MSRNTPDRGVMAYVNATAQFSSDYNGFRPNSGVAAQYHEWHSAFGRNKFRCLGH